jgi:hypothetical protein
MKKLIVVLAVAFSGVLNAQEDKETLLLNIFDALWKEEEIQIAMSGYKPDPNYKFESVIKKALAGTLNTDSLLREQPHLVRVKINQNGGAAHKSPNVLHFLDQLNKENYRDTSLYTIEYIQFDPLDGTIDESFIVINKSTNSDIFYFRLTYFLHSNLIRIAHFHDYIDN